MTSNQSFGVAAHRARGRPRAAQPDTALDEAVRVFWSQGYEGASVSRLSRQMRLPKASLYQCYGDKEGLFLASVSRYVDTRLANVGQALGPSQTLAQDLSNFFDAAVTLATSDPMTRGCLISCVLADAAGNNPRLRKELVARFTALETRICERLIVGQTELVVTVNPETAALMIASVARGLMLRARADATPNSLREVGRLTVAMLCRA